MAQVKFLQIVLFGIAFLLLSRGALAQMAIDTALPGGSYKALAQADDASSFAPDSAENKSLLERGIGFPVRVQRVFDGYAAIVASSVRALVPVPLGWRGFDDGRRTRLFAPQGKVGMVLSMVSLDGQQSWDDAREQVWKQARQTAAERAKKDARYSARLIRLADGAFGLREHNVNDGDNDLYSSVILFRPHPDDARVAIRLNVFAPVAQFERYLVLAGLVIKDVQGVAAIRPPDAEGTKAPSSKN